MEHEATVRVEGHLIDSGTLSGIFDHIIQSGATYEVVDFQIGRTNDDQSVATLRITAEADHAIAELLENLIPLGAFLVDRGEVRTESAPLDGVVPEDFYSTTNHRTEIRRNGRWITVTRQRMDSVIVLEDLTAHCTKLRDVKRGADVVVGTEGIRVIPLDKERDRAHFGFMTNEVSSEKQVELAVNRIVQDIGDARRDGGRVVVVAGPVVVHTGGVEPLESLLSGGWVDALLAGNALAVHDIERALYDTSLGVHSESGEAVVDGHRNHMRAINVIRRAGGIAAAVEAGVLSRGIMHRCVRSRVPYVLAGSLRDDGPLPEVITDMNEAQAAYGELLDGVHVVLILSTMLHGIAVGNMLPSSALTVCVDINPAVVTKLADRGSSQALGVVTDVGLFLSLLASRLGAAGIPMSVAFGVSYFGVRDPRHARADLDEIAAAGFTAVTHTFSEHDLRYHRADVARLVEETRARGLEAALDPWGVAGLFGGEAYSELALRDDSSRQIDAEGRAVPACCPSAPATRKLLRRWTRAAVEAGADVLFWDEPHFYIGAYGDRPTPPCCRCDRCRAAWEESGEEGELPPEGEPRLARFRARTLRGLLEEAIAAAGSVRHSLCLLPRGEFQGAGSDAWEELTALPRIARLATDPYWMDRPVDPAAYVRTHGQALRRICDETGREMEIWIQGIRIPRGAEHAIVAACEAAVDAGAARIAFWSFRGTERMSSLACADPDAAWAAMREAVRRFA